MHIPKLPFTQAHRPGLAAAMSQGIYTLEPHGLMLPVAAARSGRAGRRGAARAPSAGSVLDAPPALPATPVRAAAGDDDLMSQAQDAVPVRDEVALREAWQDRFAAAQARWDRITDVELASCGGQDDRLAALIHRRYGIPLLAAAAQVAAFHGTPLLRRAAGLGGEATS